MCKRCEGKIVLTTQELTEMLRAAGQPQPVPATRTTPFPGPYRFTATATDPKWFATNGVHNGVHNVATVTWLSVVDPDDGAAGGRVPA